MISAGESVSSAGEIVRRLPARAAAPCCACPMRPARRPENARSMARTVVRLTPSASQRSGSEGRLSLSRQQVQTAIAGLFEDDAGFRHEAACARAHKLLGQKPLTIKCIFMIKDNTSAPTGVNASIPARHQESSSAESQGYRRERLEKHSSVRGGQCRGRQWAHRDRRDPARRRRGARADRAGPQGGDPGDSGWRGGGEICAGDRPGDRGHCCRRPRPFA